MKLVQNHPFKFLMTISYEIKGDTVVRTFNNLRGNMVFVIDIPNIKRIYPYRASNDGLMYFGIVMLFVHAISNLAFDTIRSVHQWTFFRIYISWPIILIAVVSFLLSFIKQDWIGFQDKNNQPLFGIKQTGKPEVKEFVDRISEKISEAKGI